MLSRGVPCGRARWRPRLWRPHPLAHHASQVHDVYCVRLARDRRFAIDPDAMDAQEICAELMALLLISHLVLQGGNTGACRQVGGACNGPARSRDVRQPWPTMHASCTPLPPPRCAQLGRHPAGALVGALSCAAPQARPAGRAAQGLCSRGDCGRGAGWLAKHLQSLPQSCQCCVRAGAAVRLCFPCRCCTCRRHSATSWPGRGRCE